MILPSERRRTAIAVRLTATDRLALERVVTGPLSTAIRTAAMSTLRPRPMDLVRLHGDVRALAIAARGRACAQHGIDVEDYVQEVYLAALTRARARSGWDPDRGTLGTYIYRLAASVFANMLRRARRWTREELGWAECDEAGDVACSASTPGWDDAAMEMIDGLEMEMRERLALLRRLAAEDEGRRCTT